MPGAVHLRNFSHFRSTRPLINSVSASWSRRGLASNNGAHDDWWDDIPTQPQRQGKTKEAEDALSKLDLEEPFILEGQGLDSEYSDSTGTRYKTKATKFAQDHDIVFPAKGRSLPEHTKKHGFRATTSPDHHFCLNHLKPLGMFGPHPMNEMFFSIYQRMKKKRLWIWVYALMDHNTSAVVRSSSKRRLRAVIKAALLQNGYRPNGQRLARVAAAPEGTAIRDTELHGTFSLIISEPKRMMKVPLKELYAYMSKLLGADVIPRLRRPAVQYPQGYWTSKLETGFLAASKQQNKPDRRNRVSTGFSRRPWGGKKDRTGANIKGKP